MFVGRQLSASVRRENVRFGVHRYILEKIAKYNIDSGITTGNILYNTRVQILAYADDLDIISKN